MINVILGLAIATAIALGIVWYVLSRRKKAPKEPVEKLPRSKPPSLDRSLYTVQYMVFSKLIPQFYVPAIAVSLIKKGYIVKEGDKWIISQGEEPLKPDEEQILEKLKKRVSGEFDLRKIWKAAVTVRRRKRQRWIEVNVDVDLDPEVGSMKPLKEAKRFLGTVVISLGFGAFVLLLISSMLFPDWMEFLGALALGVIFWIFILLPALSLLLAFKANEWIHWTDKGWKEKVEWEAYKDYLFLSQPEVDANELPYAIALGAGDVVRPKDEKAKELYEAYKEVR
ncbi:MAG: DUF2207 domain-containing protein [Candidatus Micrarchaeota archaeon]|nr:DUF2207 domain-containing protein [Candidatus Micrarchaeota archaeon]